VIVHGVRDVDPVFADALAGAAVEHATTRTAPVTAKSGRVWTWMRSGSVECAGQHTRLRTGASRSTLG
jgi:hypothetical protein